MHGVTTAIVAFLFAGVIWPNLIKNRVQFYAGLIIVVFIILLDGIAVMFGGARVIYGIVALLQVAGIVTLILSAGMTLRDLSGEVAHTIDVVRRGGEKETIVVPLRGQQPRSQAERDIAAEEAALDAAEAARTGGATAKKSPADSSIPLE